MGRATNFAITLFSHLDDARFNKGSIISVGQRDFLIHDAGAIEKPTPWIGSQHRHLWIRSTRSSDNTKGSVISSKALISALKSIFGADLDIPYCKKVENAAAYRNYINKQSGSSITSNDEIVLTSIRQNPRMGNSDILALLLPVLGLDKAQGYQSKMSLLRDYVKQQDIQIFPSTTDNSTFVRAMYTLLQTADIYIPSLNQLTHQQTVLITFHHLLCMHLIPRMTSPNGDGHYGLYLYGPASSGKTTLTTGLLAHAPPPIKGVGKWNTSAPVLLFDDWLPEKLFGEYMEHIRRVALGHDLTVSIHSASRNQGPRWAIVTSNTSLEDQPLPVTRRFIQVYLSPITTPAILTPDISTLGQAYLTFALTLDWTILDSVTPFILPYKTYSAAYNSTQLLSTSTVDQQLDNSNQQDAETTQSNHCEEGSSSENDFSTSQSSSKRQLEDSPLSPCKSARHWSPIRHQSSRRGSI